MEETKCEKCRSKIPAEWLENGRCHGCRAEYMELKEYSNRTILDRVQFKRNGNGRQFMSKYGRRLGRV